MRAFSAALVAAAVAFCPTLFADSRSNHVQGVVGGPLKLQGTASQQVASGKGDLLGIFVASSTSCTIKLWDNTAASGTVLVDTFSAAAATWYPLPFAFGTGLFLTVGGTCSYTVSYNTRS